MQAAAKTGNQNPTHFVTVPSSSSDLDAWEQVYKAGGRECFPWQSTVLGSWLGKKMDGSWAASTGGLSVPRQNGKSLGTIEPRSAGGMFLNGERVVYTSHLQKTSTETFESLASFFDQKVFSKYIKVIKTAIGREEIQLKNGGRIKFLARTRNGGRGQHGDLLIFDEAQDLTHEQQASFLPALAASSNPQTIYAGTPPDENSPGEVFEGIRAKALSGESSTIAYAEWSVDEIGDVSDRSRWYACNPSLGLLIKESTIAGEFEQMDADTFARERLGWWSPKKVAEEAKPLIEEATWTALATKSPPADGLMGVGVKFAGDGSTVSLSVCLKPQDRVPYVECVDVRNCDGAVPALADWLLQRKDKIASVAIDGRTGAPALVQRLQDGHFPRMGIVQPSTRDFSAAIAMGMDAVTSGELEHYGQPALDTSATKSARRNVGRDGVGFASTADADSTLIESAFLALWTAKTTKRKPGRRAKVRI